MEDDKKFHWFSFSFFGIAARTCIQSYSCVYLGYPTRNINMERIRAAKKQADMQRGAVLISCSYLGHMTKDEMGFGS